MQEKAITLKNGQVKGIYEYFINQIQREGKNAVYSYMIYKNAEKLAPTYNEIVSKIYNENLDTDFIMFKQQAGKLIEQYADRTEDGKIKFDENKQVLITEKFDEFKKANDELTLANKSMLDARQAKIAESTKYLELSNEFSVLTISLADFPADTAPGIVGLFAEV